MENFSDQDLLLSEDPASAFAVIYNRYWEPLYKKALARLGNDADAQDTVQEIFISLWKNKTTIVIEQTLAPYLFTALKYAIIKKVYRKAKKGEFVPLSVKAIDEYGSFEENRAEAKEIQSVIYDELNNLPVRMRRIYDLSRVENLKTGEIARQLNISEQTVKNTLTTALKRLRERIIQHANFSIAILITLFS